MHKDGTWMQLAPLRFQNILHYIMNYTAISKKHWSSNSLNEGLQESLIMMYRITILNGR